ncbi:hypothetical protein Scuro_29 [Acinetobacter phage Scuro]|nr:hypothetical protein Scuro_29 [Acinetobacter phage Scuro]
MNAEKYADIMSRRAAYMRGERTEQNRLAHNIYTKWINDGLAMEYRQKYAKLSNTVKLHEINKILVSCIPDEEKVKGISEIMKR